MILFFIMKRYVPLFIIAVALFAIICVSQYAESSKEHCEETAAKVKAALVAKRDDSKPKDDANDACRPPIWARYFTWPEGVGAWAVILTLFVVAWQSIETRAAAKATEDAAKGTQDSIRLQEAVLEQWLETTDWRAELSLPEFDEHLYIRVDVINRTQHPITIKEGALSFMIRDGGSHDSYTFTEETFLTPGVPHQVSGWLKLTKKQAAKFATEPITVTVFGSFIHVGVLKRSTSQKLWGELMCSKFAVVFTAKLHMNPKQAKKDQELWDRA